MSVVSVNSSADGEDNNGPNKGSFLFLRESENLIVQTTTDTYPAETFWQIMDDGKVAAERQSFNKAKTTFSDTICLEANHCYTFNVFDRFGDGSSEGGVKIFYKGDTVVSLGSDSINSRLYEIDLCLNTLNTSIDNTINSPFDLEVFPNPTSNQITLVFPDYLKGPVNLSLMNYNGQILHVDLSLEKIITKKILIHK